MKKSPNTDEVSLRSAKESTRGGKIVQPRENDTKLIPCGSWKGLDNGQPWQEYSENAAENHLETVNIESNGKSRMIILKSIILSLCIFGAINVRGNELLVTQSGNYTSKDKMVAINVAASTKDRINLHIVFKSQLQVPAAGGDVEVTSSTQVDDLPVKPDRWAFCISKEGDVWFYDGGGAFTQVRNLPDRIQTLKSCSSPNLGDQAPEVMKKWIKKA